MEAVPSARRNFLLMSVCFSVIHGICTTPLAYATTLLGAHGGNVANGTLYATNVFGSLFLSVLVVNAVGLKGGLIVCTSLYTLYIGFFAVVLHFDDAMNWFFAIPSSICGGLAFAIGWTAQGGYFSRSASIIAEAEGQPRHVVNVELAGTFALNFLIFEVVGKVGFSLLQGADVAPSVIFALYFAVSLLVTIVLAASIDRIDMGPRPPGRGCPDEMFDTLRLWRDPRLWLLSPTNFTFGFAAAYMNGYVNRIFAQDVGMSAVGYIAALAVGVSALLTQVYSPLSLHCGKGLVVGIGGLSFFGIPLVNWLGGGSDHRSAILLSFLYILQGSGRAVYESTNKAIIADAFPGAASESAFANSFVELSFAAAVCFFLQNWQSSMLYPGFFLMVLASLMVPTYQLSLHVDKYCGWREELDPECKRASEDTEFGGAAQRVG